MYKTNPRRTIKPIHVMRTKPLLILLAMPESLLKKGCNNELNTADQFDGCTIEIQTLNMQQ